MQYLNEFKKKKIICWGYICLNQFFSHGQLYVTLSRVTSRLYLHFTLQTRYDEKSEDINATSNVIYKKVFKMYFSYFMK